MTNEEIVTEIKKGNKNYLSDLWSAVEKFIIGQAHKFHIKYNLRCAQLGVEVDDLVQVGYFAILDAIEAYTGEFKFITYLNYHLRNQFFILAKMKSTGWQKNTVHQACSLNNYVGEDDNLSYIDLISDTKAEKAFDDIVEDDYNNQLKIAFSSAFCALTSHQREVIKRIYIDGITLTKCANEFGVTKGSISNSKAAAFKKLRKDKELSGLALTLA